jgi:hypothetical protein
MFSHSVTSDIIEKSIIRDKAYDAFIANTVGSPPNGFDIRVGEFVAQGCL